MDRGVFWALLYFSAVVLVVALILLLLWPLLAVVAWAGILSVAAQPVHRSLLRRCRGNRALASLLTTFLVLVAVAGPVLVLAIVFANEAAQVLSAAEQALAEGRIPAPERWTAYPLIAKFIARVSTYVSVAELRASLTAALRSATTTAVSFSRSLALNILAAIFKSAVMLVLLFFALRDGESIARNAWAVVPLKERDRDLIADTVRRVVYAVLYGIVFTCIVQGSLVGVGFAFVRLPSPVFFGALAIAAAFVPAVGAALVWVPAVLYLFAVGTYGRAVFLLIWGALVVSSIDNVIRPIFISGRARIPFIVILLGVLGGLLSAGFVGIILGPLLLAVSIELFRIFREDMYPESPVRIDLEE